MRALTLLAMGCSGAVLPGDPSLRDVDGDGWTTRDGDCDDDDPAVHPAAIDRPGDGIDQDCDGADADALDVRGLEPGDLRITEIQREPIGVEGALGEWFELHNALDVPVDLLGLGVRNEAGDLVRVGQSFVVEPGGLAVLGLSADPLVNGEVPVDVALGPDLRIANASGALVLLDGARELGGQSWDATFPREDGRALQLDPAALDPSRADAWCSAEPVYGIGGWGSPGQANPGCPGGAGATGLVFAAVGDLVITEIMKDPDQVPDAAGEWIEIHNASAIDLDRDGLELVDAAGDGVQLVGRTLLPAGGYAVLAASADPLVNGGLPAVLLGWGDAFSLPNSEATIVIRFGTRVFDAVTYDNGVAFPDPTGASLQLAPGLGAADNDAGAAWCVATTAYGDGDLGTPGAPNPPC